MNEIKTKKCSKCGNVKPIDEFAINIRLSSQRSACCKECHRAYINARRDERIKRRNHIYD